MRRLATLGTAAAILIALSGCGSDHSVQPLDVGLVAPAFELQSVTSSGSVTSESLKGEIVVLNFWSTSCSVCLQEIDELKEIHDSGKAHVVGIALDEDSQHVRSVLEKRGVEYPVLLGDQATFERFDGFSIPYTLVLDRSQVVRKRFFGRMTAEDFDAVWQAMQEPQHVAMRSD